MLNPSTLFFVSTARFARSLVQQGVLKDAHLGNPKVLSSGEMEQDEVVPCVTAFSSGARLLDDSVLEQFQSINAWLWETGLLEASISMDKYGFIGDRLVLYDFFELSTFRDDWEMLIAMKWWRQTNAMFLRFRPNLLERLDEIFMSSRHFSTGEIEAPEECRHMPARLYAAHMKKFRGNLPWLSQ